MMRYAIMKRITQMFASILFIITVLTVYLAFDFAISHAVPKKYSTDKYDDNIFKQTTSVLSLLQVKKSNQTFKYNNDNEYHPINNQERRTRSGKQKQYQVKAAKFHKSKTGIKINQIKKPSKELRKRLLTTKISQRKDIKFRTDKIPI